MLVTFSEKHLTFITIYLSEMCLKFRPKFRQILVKMFNYFIHNFSKLRKSSENFLKISLNNFLSIFRKNIWKIIKKFWVKFPERFRIISEEKFEDKLRKIEANFKGNLRKKFMKNFCVNLKKF